MYWKIIIAAVLILNLITFIIYGVDKYKAKHNKWRIPEFTLIFLAVLGGSIGAILGMQFFHHKTKKPKFFIGVPTILILQIFAIVFVYLKFIR